MIRTLIDERIEPVWGPRLRTAGTRASIISPLGWAVLVMAITSWILGLRFQLAEVIAVAIMTTILLLAAIAFILRMLRYHVDINLGAQRIVAGERAVGELLVSSASRAAMPPSMLEMPVGSAIARFEIPQLAPDQTHDELFTIPTQRRAVLTIGPVRSVRSDPFALLRRVMAWTQPQELYVHPRTVMIPDETIGVLRDLEGLPTQIIANDDISFHALREYVPGDDVRYVHWKSTARSQKLMVRQFEETRRSHLSIIVSNMSVSYSGDDEFELALSVAASLAIAAIKEGRTVTVNTTEAELPTRTVMSLLDGFSGVEFAPGRRDERLGPLSATVAHSSQESAVTIVISGAQTSLEDLRAAALHAPGHSRVLAIRTALGEDPARQSIGDLVIVTIDDLATLGMALRVAV